MTDTLRKVGDKIAEPYQHRILEKLRIAIEQSQSGAVMAPTGAGKSLIAAGAVEDATALNKPILVLHPDVSLLRQNMAQFHSLPSFEQAKISVFTAQNEIFAKDVVRNDLAADVILATNMSLVNKVDDTAFVLGLEAFGKRGGIVLIDEGHKAAAEKLSSILAIIAKAGGAGIVLTATPFRADGLDPLDAFDAEIERDMIGVAGYAEVLKTGRTVPTRFELATREFERHLGAEAVNQIEDSFAALIADSKSIDQASQAAFGKFFKDTASKTDAAIAHLIVSATTEIWLKRVANATTTMIHCDCVAFSRKLAEAISRQKFPKGHPRAKTYPRVAWIVASDTRLFTDGAERTPADFGWKKSSLRDSILAAARRNEFDVLVNVNALGVGTDVPATDLNILACQQRSIGPVKQISGRGERSYPSKTHQKFVDIGNSIFSIWCDIDAMRRSEPQRARRQIRELPKIIREQFEAWFDADPTLADQIRARIDEKRNRTRGESEDTEDEPELEDIDSSFVPGGIEPPEYLFLAPGIKIAMTAKKITKEIYTHRYGIIVDLNATKLIPLESEAPSFLALFIDEDTNLTESFLAKREEKADAFLSFLGLKGRPQHQRDKDKPLTPGQSKFIRRLVTLPQARAVPGIHTNPKTSRQGSMIISLLKTPDDASKRPVLLQLLLDGSNHLLSRALDHSLPSTPLKTLILEKPNDIRDSRLDIVIAASRLRAHLATLLPQMMPPHLNIVVYDHTILPTVMTNLTQGGSRVHLVDETNATRLHEPLAQAIIAQTVETLCPKGSDDNALRQRAGLSKITQASSLRETQWRELLDEVASGGKLTIIQMQRKYLASAISGNGTTTSVAQFAALLMKLLDINPVPCLTSTDESFNIVFDQTQAIIQFIRSPVRDQTNLISAAQKLAVFNKVNSGFMRQSLPVNLFG